MSHFIASNYFHKLAEENSQLELIDTLYLKAIDYYADDISEALLALTFSTFTFQKMSVSLPILGLTLKAPLPTMPDSLFNKRLENLPSHFLIDSPNSDNSDKDKLPHFFGSAFLSYNLRFFNFSKFMGILVELFEETFKVQGEVDSRDLIINSFGDLFGTVLNNKNDVLPSQVLELHSILYHKHKFH
ncbi:hypothetical protein ACFLTH_06530 [Bacteroidota bacterium]